MTKLTGISKGLFVILIRGSWCSYRHSPLET
jgi:hypothetical protein